MFRGLFRQSRTSQPYLKLHPLKKYKPKCVACNGCLGTRTSGRGPVLSSSCRTLTTQRLPRHPGHSNQRQAEWFWNDMVLTQNPSEYNIVFHFNCRSAALRRDSPAICIVSTLLAPISCQGTWLQDKQSHKTCPKLAQTHPNDQRIHSAFDQNHCLPSKVPQPPRGLSQLKHCQRLRIQSHPNLSPQILRIHSRWSHVLLHEVRPRFHKER